MANSPSPRARAATPGRVAAAAAAAAAAALIVWRAAAAVRAARAYRRAAARLRDVRAEIDGLRLRARVDETTGRGGAPIVFVHGFGVSSAYWVPLATRLAARHPVYVPDLRAYGDSPDRERTADVGALAGVLLGWLDALGLDRAALVANSMGCQVAAELAARHPRRVAALVLVGPTVDPEARGLGTLAGRLVASAPFEPAALDALVVRDYFRAGPALLADELRAMLAHHIERVLPRLAAPTLVVRGEHDWIVPRRWAAEAARLARGDWIEIPGAGHAAHFERADAVARTVETFLARAGVPGAR